MEAKEHTTTKYPKVYWITAPIGFGIIYRVLLYLYFLSSRPSYNSADPLSSSPFFEGHLDGRAIIATGGYGIVLLLMFFMLPRLSLRGILFSGVATGTLSLLLSFIISDWLWQMYGYFAAMHLPTLIASLGVVLFLRKYQRDLKEAQELAEM